MAVAQKAPKSKSNEIHITRIYDAPVKAVWDAWTDPDQVGKWWGPRGFTITTHTKDLRPGGTWKYTMHGPDGKDWPNITKYYEVEKHTRLVYDHGATEDRPAMFRVTVTFAEHKGKTTMGMTMALETPEKAEETRKMIKMAGGNSTWDRLAEYLEKESSGKEKFVIARTFDAPIETVFEMWSNPKHVSQWLAPVGFDMSYIRADVRVGGNSFYSMTNHKDVTMYGRAAYLAVEKPTRLVYTQEFCDEKENLSRHPKLPTFPAAMLTTVQFVEEAPDRTRVIVTWEPHGPTKPDELAAFVAIRAGMTQGWTGSFDKLEEYLSSQ
jgi:uncharacterized protein YndB with AHSA1/START domain